MHSVLIHVRKQTSARALAQRHTRSLASNPSARPASSDPLQLLLCWCWEKPSHIHVPTTIVCLVPCISCTTTAAASTAAAAAAAAVITRVPNSLLWFRCWCWFCWQWHRLAYGRGPQIAHSPRSAAIVLLRVTVAFTASKPRYQAFSLWFFWPAAAVGAGTAGASGGCRWFCCGCGAALGEIIAVIIVIGRNITRQQLICSSFFAVDTCCLAAGCCGRLRWAASADVGLALWDCHITRTAIEPFDLRHHHPGQQIKG